MRPRRIVRAIAVLLVATLAAACLETKATDDAPQPSLDANALGFLPLVAATTCPRTTNCYEPTIAADPQGRLFVSDGGTSDVGVSADGGVTWTTTKPPPMPAGLNGRQGDIIVQVSPSGRLYWSALVIVQPQGQGFVLEGLQIAWSDDGAQTWAGNVHLSPATLAPQVVSPDRQWLGFGPGQTMYVTYNQVPTGIWIARSDDAGKTWSAWTRAAPLEGRRGGIGQSGPPVVDASGRVFVPACSLQDGTTFVFSSQDRAATFRATEVPGGCNWFPILAITSEDELVLAVQPGNVRIASSKDQGRTFTAMKDWARGATAAAWPVPLGNGSIAVAWFKVGASSTELHVTFGDIATGPRTDLTVGTTKGTSGQSSALTDFASATSLPDGRLATVLVQGKEALVSLTGVPIPRAP